MSNTVTVQPSDADTWLSQIAPDSNNSGGNLNIRSLNASRNSYPILKFDFTSEVPGGSVITAAMLSLRNLGGSTSVGRVHEANRITQAGWVEAEATWNDYATSTAWAVAGGDITAVDVANATVTSPPSWTEWDVLNQVIFAQNTVSNVAHFLIKDSIDSEASIKGNEYAASDDGDTSIRPKLFITYTAPTVEFANDLPLLSVSAAGAPGAELTFPALSVSAFGGAGADLTFPAISVQGGSGATGQFSFSALTLSAVGHETNEASLTLPMLTLFAVPPPTTITLPVLSVSAEVTTKGTFAKSFPVLTLSATAAPLRGVVQITLPQFTTTFSAIQGSADGTTINLPAFTISIRTGLTVSNVLPQFTIAATAQVGAVGTYNKSLPRMTITAGATQQSRATNDITLPVFTLDATLKTGEISLTSTRNLPGLRLSATGFVGVPGGDVDLTFPAFELATFGYQSLNGTVVQSLKMLTLNAYADVYTNRII